MSYQQRILNLITSDEVRMRALHAVKSLNLPDWLIAAGFVRNMVWDNLYGHETKLNDIDVVYYCPFDCTEERDFALQNKLDAIQPRLPWSVKNQARMHVRNGDMPYLSTVDAMAYWPEKQTAIGVKLDHRNQVVVRHSFGLSFLFNGQINRNPKRSIDIFNDRVNSKRWLETWPSLHAKA